MQKSLNHFKLLILFENYLEHLLNTLGVLLDCKLQWDHHNNQVIHMANKELNAITLIGKFFNSS
jgi:hypothetical protein